MYLAKYVFKYLAKYVFLPFFGFFLLPLPLSFFAASSFYFLPRLRPFVSYS